MFISFFSPEFQVKRFIFLNSPMNRWMKVLISLLWRRIEKKYENWFCNSMNSKRINFTMEKKKTNNWPQSVWERLLCAWPCDTILCRWNGQNFFPLVFFLLSFSLAAGFEIKTDGIGFFVSFFLRLAVRYSILIGINNLWNIFYWYLCWFISLEVNGAHQNPV